MIEVEAKVKIGNPKDLRSRIKKVGKFFKKIKKIDDYYTLENLVSYPKKSLRVRKLGEKYEVNIKKKISYIKGVHAKEEVELNSKERDLEVFLRILRDFGFRKWLRKEKLSEVYKIGKNFSIEINKVKNLGWYLEVEYLSRKGEIKKARRKVLEVIDKLGIKRKDVIKDGYTKMLWDLKRS